MRKLLIICGPTATGKTTLAVECAKRLDTQIISADSQLVYRGLNIGTAKPTADEMDGVTHHMIDIADPKESFSVGDYREQAMPILERLLNEDKTPVICGGTGFYINSLLYDFSYGNAPANSEIRKKYEKLLKEEGKDFVYNELKRVDFESAEKLHPNDTKRVIRALEIYEAGGRKKSDFHEGKEAEFPYTAFAVNYPRDELYKRIEKRVDTMFDEGLVEEVENLLKSGVNEDSQCMQAIGYKEVVYGLKNGNLQSTMRDIIKLNTRHYAKRQITFFKKLPGIVWLEPENATADKILEIYNEQTDN